VYLFSKILIVPALLMAFIVGAMFMGYGMAYPSILSLASLIMALGLIVGFGFILLDSLPPGRAPLFSALLVGIGAISLYLACLHARKSEHAQITANFVLDLNNEFSLVTSQPKIVPAGTTVIGFFHGSFDDPLVGMRFPMAFLVRQIPIFERDHAIMEKEGRYYVDASGPDYFCDPLLLHHFRQNYPALFPSP
jgi:hypothetical protein